MSALSIISDAQPRQPPKASGLTAVETAVRGIKSVSILLNPNSFYLLRFFLLHFIFSLLVIQSPARQTTDTSGTGILRNRDSINNKDTAKPQLGYSAPAIISDSISVSGRDKFPAPQQELIKQLFKQQSSISLEIPETEKYTGEKVSSNRGKELLFYLLVFLFISLAFLKNIFSKYFNDLFRLFFRTTLKQRQIRDQLMQTPLPSLLLNGFFVVSAGLYASFLVQHYRLAPGINFWMIFLYGCAGLSAVYFLKFAGLKAAGWIFNMQEMADDYIFIVFIINKMTGVLLLPFLLVIAFSAVKIYIAALFLSYFLLGGLLLYRFILSFAAVRNGVRVNPFHFFLYLCAFEIAPLLLIYKGLLLFFGITA